MTSGGVAAAAQQRNASVAIVNVTRIISDRSYHFVIAVWSTKRTDGKRFVVRADERLSAFPELELAARRAQRLIWRR